MSLTWGAKAYQVRDIVCHAGDCALGLLELEAGRACDHAGICLVETVMLICCNGHQTMFLIELAFVQIVYQGADCQREPEKARDVTESV